MTVRVRIRREPGEIVLLAVAAGVALVGAATLLGSRSPLIVVAAPIGAVALVVAARRPVVALCIMAIVEFTNLSGLLAPRSGLPVFQVSLLLGLLSVGFALRDPLCRSRINGWTLVCGALLATYLATQGIALLGSVDPTASAATLYRQTVDCVFVMIVLLLVQLTARPWPVAAAIVVTLAALCTLTIISQVATGGTADFGGLSTVTTASGEGITTLRYGGPLPDSNFWGRHLVMGLPMAAALMTRALRHERRAVFAGWVLALVLLLGGVYLTQSRGTFLAAGVAIAVWFVAVERSVRRWALVLIPLGAVAFAVPGVGDRLLVALDDLTKAEVQSSIDPSVLGRLAAQQEAWMMFDERPLFGFGPGTFSGQVINFAGRVPLAVREPAAAPHNLYAELAAESGWTGLLGWGVVMAGFIGIAVLRIVADPRSRDRVLAAAVCAALVAWSVASIGLHMAYFRSFGVVLALVGGIAPAWPVAADAVRRFTRGVATWGAAALVGAATCWVSLSFTSSTAVTAMQPITLVPVGPVDGWYSYALDVRSRAEMLPTIATVVDDPASPVDVVADPVRGVLAFTTTADTTDQARDEIQVAATAAETRLRDAIGYQQYALQPVGSMRVTPTRERSLPATAASLGLGLLAALAVAARLSSRRRPVSSDRPIEKAASWA
ncbi:O-antigen ligase [Mycobacterium sp. PSTR-4-N]|uniref:O-antigen ligase family protein n=1 Tax=Mycobacterium sp. PSTR-4-N TaxID=2917745 RepID=UPI001F155AF3|nr:O-antigen ligase family protein [Mycobacterium sp. PSTR-4-N]MCG7596287.1 O-antigen ligase family protein [Mycobacterium sp. PSTR-4-N]